MRKWEGYRKGQRRLKSEVGMRKWEGKRKQMTRLRSPSLGLRPSGYDPTRRRGTQMTDDGRQKTDDGGQKTDDGGQRILKSEVGMRKSERKKKSRGF